MKVIITFTFSCNNLWKNKFMALEKPGKLVEFSSTFWPPWFCLTDPFCVVTAHRTSLQKYAFENSQK